MSGGAFGRRRWLGDAMVAGRPLSRILDATCLVLFGVAMVLARVWLDPEGSLSGWVPFLGAGVVLYGLYVFFTSGRYWVSTLVYLGAGLFVVYLMNVGETHSVQESDRRPSRSVTSEPATRANAPAPSTSTARTQLRVDQYITLLRQGRIKTATIYAAEGRIEGAYDRGEYTVQVGSQETIFSRVVSALEDAGVRYTVR